MSLFGSLMGEFDDDIFGNQMNAMNMQMRSMNRLMNSLMPDPFNMLTNFDSGFQQNALMERQGGHNMGGLFGFPTMPSMNRLLSADIGNNGTSFCSSSVITMSSGPDGRPQIYQASSSTKTGPGGIRETRRSVQDSVNGVKKMAIGHHIGERAHIIEKEQDLRSGQLEERQEFINLEEEQAEDFDREFTTKARTAIRGSNGGGNRGYAAIAAPPPRAITIEPVDDDDDEDIEGDIQQQANVRHPQRQPTSSSSSHSARRQMPVLSAQQNQSQNSSATENTTNTASSVTTTMSSPSSSTAATTMIMATTPTLSSSTLSAYADNANAGAGETSPSSQLLRQQQQQQQQQPSRRIHYYHHRGSHLITSSPVRRTVRTPASSPLIITSAIPSLSTTYASTSSVHPHPYNTSAARRNHHRSKQHSKSQQQQEHSISKQDMPSTKQN